MPYSTFRRWAYEIHEWQSGASLKIIILVSSFFSFKSINDKNAQYFIESTSFHLILINTVLGSRCKYYPHFIVKKTELLEHWNCFPKTAVAWCKAGAAVPPEGRLWRRSPGRLLQEGSPCFPVSSRLAFFVSVFLPLKWTG